MLLVPPSDAQYTQPLYHITVNMNCLVPYAFNITVRRGVDEGGRIIGEFEYVTLLYLRDTANFVHGLKDGSIRVLGLYQTA